MTTTMKRTIRYVTATAAALLLGGGLLAAPAAAGDWSSNYRQHHEHRGWSAEPNTERLFRQILKSFINGTDRHHRYQPKPPKIHRAKGRHRHATHEVCRIKTKVIIDRYGDRKRITRTRCREVEPRHRRWNR